MTEIYTVGHSNHEAGAFLALLQQHGIELLADEPLEVKERLVEMHHIHAFYERERPKLLERWKKEWAAYKKENF